MAQALLIARNPDADSSLPYLVLIPLGSGIVLRTRETWPRTSKVYCHRHQGPWPEDAEIVEELPLASVSRRGAAIDVVAARTREARSQFEVVVDTRERYPWKFTHQQATTTRRALPVGDYAALVEDDVVAVVERRTLADLAGSLTSGRMAYRMGALAEAPRAAVVVEERYSAVFALEHVRPALVADLIGECQVRWPSVPVVFAENRALAQEWTYRFLASAVQERLLGEAARRILPDGPSESPEPGAATGSVERDPDVPFGPRRA